MPAHRPRPAKPAILQASAVFVDSSAFIALFSADDSNHQRADHLFRTLLAERRPLVTSSLVVAEVHRLLLFRAGIAAARAAIGRIDAAATLRLQFPAHRHHEAALAWLTRLSDQVISYADAISFALMADLKLEHALSFDHDFYLAGYALYEA